MSEKRLTQDDLETYLCDTLAELQPYLKEALEQNYHLGLKHGLKLGLKSQQKPRISGEHALAKLIDTLRWKFGHCEKTVSVNISWDEYHEIKDFVEVKE